MAEAIAAFGLAANIIQFLDFGSRLTVRFWSFYQSSRKSKDGVPDLTNITKDLKRISASLTAPGQSTESCDEGLSQLAAECEAVANELLALLAKLAGAKDSHSHRYDAIRAAFTHIWKESEIEALRSRLDYFRSQLSLHLLASLRTEGRKTLEQQGQVLRSISAIQEGTGRLEKSMRKVNDVTLDHEGIGNLFVEFLTSKLDASCRKQEQSHWQEILVSSIFESESHDNVSGFAAPEISSSREKRLRSRFLQRLCYLQMDDREERITDAHEATFQWLLADSSNGEAKWSNLKDWLQADSQLYWVTGKAGSGKSTLMKYLSHPCYVSTSTSSSQTSEPRVRQHLEIWANRDAPCRLILATFYFWNSGTQLQMAQGGLFRTLLFQILSEIPQLIPLVAPKKWEALCLFDIDNLDFSEPELKAMLRAAAQQLPSEVKLCLFIDGLDEFDGDHNTLIELLQDLHMNPRIKLCVASRPWVVFEDAFERHASLRLEQLTYRDMRAYTSSYLAADTGFALLQKREPEYAQQLVENIVAKASGVFLWVKLVVSSLLAGMGHGDRISDMQRRLDILPPELERLYDKILDSLDPFYLEHAAQLFQLLHESPDPMSLLLLSFVDEDSWEGAVSRPVRRISADEAMMRAETMRRRINSRCKGLLEAHYAGGIRDGDEPGPEFADSTVQYLHRTVKDFLQSRETQNRVQSALRSPFDPHLQLCSGNLAFLKTVNQPSFEGRLQHSFWRIVSRILHCAAKISRENADACVRLMDGLDHTGRQLAAFEVSSPDFADAFEYEQWVALHPMTRDPTFGCHFLSLAVRYGVTEYVMARANSGCFIQRPVMTSFTKDDLNTSCIHPLLRDAVTKHAEEDALESVPNYDMVSCLLQKGAKFETTGPGGFHLNLWFEMITDIVHMEDAGNPTEAWIKIAELALQSGNKLPAWPMIQKHLKEGGLPRKLSTRYSNTMVALEAFSNQSSLTHQVSSWFPWPQKKAQRKDIT